MRPACLDSEGSLAISGILFAAPAPLAAPLTAPATQRSLPPRHRLQQPALLLQRTALQLCCLLCPPSPFCLHCKPVKPALQLLALLCERCVGGHRSGSLGLSLRGKDRGWLSTSTCLRGLDFTKEDCIRQKMYSLVSSRRVRMIQQSMPSHHGVTCCAARRPSSAARCACSAAPRVACSSRVSLAASALALLASSCRSRAATARSSRAQRSSSC